MDEKMNENANEKISASFIFLIFISITITVFFSISTWQFEKITKSIATLQKSVDALQPTKPETKPEKTPEAQKANPTILPEMSPSSLEMACLKEETIHMDIMSAQQKCKQQTPSPFSCTHERILFIDALSQEINCIQICKMESTCDAKIFCKDQISNSKISHKSYRDCLSTTCPTCLLVIDPFINHLREMYAPSIQP